MRKILFMAVATSYLIALTPFDLHNISQAHNEGITGLMLL